MARGRACVVLPTLATWGGPLHLRALLARTEQLSLPPSPVLPSSTPAASTGGTQPGSPLVVLMGSVAAALRA